MSAISFKKKLAAALVVLNLFVAVLAALSVLHDRRQEIKQAEATTANLATVVDRNIAGLIERIDLALLAARDEYSRQEAHGGVSPTFGDFLIREAERIPEAFALRIADASGRIVYDEGAGVSVNIADRDHFIRARDNVDAGLIVGRPVLARIGKKWVLPVARRINRRDGTFGGILYALIDLQKLEGLFSRLDVGRYGGIALRDDEMGLIVRVPAYEGVSAQIGDKSVSAAAKNFANSGQVVTTYTVVVPADQRERTVTIRKVGQLPLYVIATLAPEEYLADWRNQTYRTLLLVIAFLTASSWFGWLLARSWERRLKVTYALEESEERFKTVADFTYDWEYWRGPDRELIHIAPSCERITGYMPSEFVADPGLVERIIHPDDRHLMDGHLANFRDDHEHVLDFRIIRKDGGIRWIAHGCRAVFGNDGAFKGRRVNNRDITDRKQAEAELFSAKESLALAMEATSLSLWDLDITTGVVAMDSHWAMTIDGTAVETITTAEELLKQTHRDDAQKVVQAAIETFKGSTPMFQEEFRFRTPSGAWKWIRCSGKVVERDAGGRATRAIGTNLDISDRKAAEEEIRHWAFFDRLTGLPNRRLLEDRLQQQIVRAQREHQRLSLLFIDLDKFKPINDELGHEVGDGLLQAVAQRMLGCLRESDTVARIGGDEFVALLPDVKNADDAMSVAEKLRRALEKPFVAPAGGSLSISSSIGVALFPDHAGNSRDLLRCGDDAMYRAKKAGRNAVELGSDSEASADREAPRFAQERPIVHLIWKEAYARGEPAIDQEHRELFRLANALLDRALAADEDREAFNAAFDALLAGIAEHFGHEEAILSAHHFARVDQHTELHRQLLERASRLRYQRGEAGVSVGAVVDFLVSDIVAGHMLREDREFCGLFAGPTT